MMMIRFFETSGEYQRRVASRRIAAKNIPGIRIYLVLGWVSARVIEVKPL
jgi:hypothetical protein